MDQDLIPCPFVYANGRKCCGVVRQARAYGPTRGKHYVNRADVRKYRLWCSDKDDHAGAVSDHTSKERMEFYPDELPPGVRGTALGGRTDGLTLGPLRKGRPFSCPPCPRASGRRRTGKCPGLGQYFPANAARARGAETLNIGKSDDV